MTTRWRRSHGLQALCVPPISSDALSARDAPASPWHSAAAPACTSRAPCGVESAAFVAAKARVALLTCMSSMAQLRRGSRPSKFRKMTLQKRMRKEVR